MTWLIPQSDSSTRCAPLGNALTLPHANYISVIGLKGKPDMVVTVKQLLARDGAEFHARIERGGYNQVVLVMQVRLGNQGEPEQRHIVTDPATARQIAKQFAEERGFNTLIWDD